MSCSLFLTLSKEGKKGHLDLIISLPLQLEEEVPFFFFFFFWKLVLTGEFNCFVLFFFNHIWSLLKNF